MERQEELTALLQETSAEARSLRHTMPQGSMPHYYQPLAGDLHLPEGSLAFELNDSLRREQDSALFSGQGK